MPQNAYTEGCKNGAVTKEREGAEYCTKPRAAPEIRTVLSASSAPIRDPKAKWVCAWMPSIPVCSVRPAPQFIIRRCRCEGATPSSPLAVCMHKPAAEPINQSSIHLPVGRPRSSSFLSPRPTVNVVIMFWRPRNHYFPFRLAATVARPAGSAGTDSPGSGRSRVSRISLAAGRGRSGRGRRDVRSVGSPRPRPRPRPLRRGVNDW